MACRLRQQDQAVGHLGLIDVWPPTAALTLGEAAARRWAGRLETVLSPDGPSAIVRRLRDRFRRSAADPERRAFFAAWETANALAPGERRRPNHVAAGRPPAQ